MTKKLISAAEVERVAISLMEELTEIRDDDNGLYESSFVDKASAAKEAINGLLLQIRALPDATPSPGEEVERLREALFEYGLHKDFCSIRFPFQDCDCGFRATLNPQTEEKGE